MSAQVDLYRGIGAPPTCCLACRSGWDEQAEEAGVAFSAIAMRRMTLCPVCGNKRCPKATDHALTCTGSNDPNQPGSAYQYVHHPQSRHGREDVRCVHSVPSGGVKGVCERCARTVVANGCGPGWLPLDEVDGVEWRVCSDGKARWYGRQT